MDALKLLAIGLIACGLILSFSTDQTGVNDSAGDVSYTNGSAPIGGRQHEGLAGGYQPLKGELIIHPYDKE